MCVCVVVVVGVGGGVGGAGAFVAAEDQHYIGVFSWWRCGFTDM